MGRCCVAVQVRCPNVEKPFANLQPDSLQSKPRPPRGFERFVAFIRNGNGDVLVNRIPLRTGIFAAVALGVLLASYCAAAQEPGNVPETKAPAATQAAPAAASDYETARNKQLREDWPSLTRFRDADLKLGSPAPGEKRVVFMGDSITEFWKIDVPGTFFPGKPYVNRGISGQTTPQMVLRFHQDVIDLQPKVVVILGGINDIAGNTGTETLEQIEDNLAAMAEMATAHHIGVVLCSVLPAFDFPWRRGMTPAPEVLALNRWIKQYAAANHEVYVDYHTAMKDERDGLPPNLSKDGVHPTPAGYAIMAPLVEAGIEKALKAGNKD
jgi:lysophospholipase L1-like esterase